MDGNIELFFPKHATHVKNSTYTVLHATRIYHSSSKKWKPWFRWCTMRTKKKFAYAAESGIHWNFYRDEYKNNNNNKQQHLQSKPQETEDRFDCFIQLFQHLMDLHWDFNQRKLNGRKANEKEKGKNVLNTCHWIFNSFRVQLRFFWIVFSSQCIENGQSSTKY